MAVKSLRQIFYYHSKYLNSMKCREISMGPSIRTIQCSLLSWDWKSFFCKSPSGLLEYGICHQRKLQFEQSFIDFNTIFF
jgi:hypothetical protein